VPSERRTSQRSYGIPQQYLLGDLILVRPLRDLRWLVAMFVICVPIILWTYWATHAYVFVQFQISVVVVGTIAAAAVWYFFGDIIIEGATRIYETFRGEERERIRESQVYGHSAEQGMKYCIDCRTQIPRRARFCHECGAEQQ